MNSTEWTDKIAKLVEKKIEEDTWCHYVSWGELNEMVIAAMEDARNDPPKG